MMLSNNPGLLILLEKFANRRFKIFSEKIITKKIKALIIPMLSTRFDGVGFFSLISLRI
jgi:hypothetical protein